MELKTEMVAPEDIKVGDTILVGNEIIGREPLKVTSIGHSPRGYFWDIKCGHVIACYAKNPKRLVERVVE